MVSVEFKNVVTSRFPHLDNFPHSKAIMPKSRNIYTGFKPTYFNSLKHFQQEQQKKKKLSEKKKKKIVDEKSDKEQHEDPEYTIEYLGGLKQLLRKKKAGQTIQEKKKKSEQKKIEKTMKEVEKDLMKRRKRQSLSRRELTELVRKESELQNESPLENGQLYDEGEEEEEEDFEMESESSGDELEKNLDNDDESADEDYRKDLLKSLTGKRKRSKVTKEEMLALAKLEERQRLEETEGKKSILKNLREAKNKLANPKKGRSKLNLELLEKSATEALRYMTEKEDSKALKDLQDETEDPQEVDTPAKKRSKSRPDKKKKKRSVDDDDDSYEAHQLSLKQLIDGL